MKDDRADTGKAGGVTIEAAGAADLRAMVDLLGRCGLPPDGLAEQMGAALVARKGGALVGCAALELYGRYALLRSVAVAPAARGRGLGQWLALAALALAREKGVEEVYLLTETAAGYFDRFGFRPVERSDVPAAVQQSVEFVRVCPESAQAMAAGCRT